MVAGNVHVCIFIGGANVLHPFYSGGSNVQSFMPFFMGGQGGWGFCLYTFYYRLLDFEHLNIFLKSLKSLMIS